MSRIVALSRATEVIVRPGEVRFKSANARDMAEHFLPLAQVKRHGMGARLETGRAAFRYRLHQKKVYGRCAAAVGAR